MDLEFVQGLVLTLAVPLVVAGAILGGIIYFLRAEKNRRSGGWKQLAKISGLTYYDDGTKLRPELREAPIGESRQIGRVRRGMTGTVGDLWLAIVEAEKNPSTMAKMSVVRVGPRPAITYCILIQNDVELPTFTLSNKLGVGLFDRLTSIVLPGVVIADDKEFSDRCSLESSDEKAVRELFSESVRAYFREPTSLEMAIRKRGETKEINYPLAVHAAERSLTVTCPVEMEAEQIEPFLKKTKSILAAFAN